MKCDLSIGAYNNYFSREAVTHSVDHNDICCLVHSALELLKREGKNKNKKNALPRKEKLVLYKTRLQSIMLS